jgi:hypothetical protein
MHIRSILVGVFLLVGLFFSTSPVGEAHVSSALIASYGAYAEEYDCDHLGEEGQPWVGIYAQSPERPSSPWYGTPYNGYEVCLQFYGNGWVEVPLWGNFYQNIAALNPTVSGYLIDQAGRRHFFSATQTSLLRRGCSFRAVSIVFNLPYSGGGRAG